MRKIHLALCPTCRRLFDPRDEYVAAFHAEPKHVAIVRQLRAMETQQARLNSKRTQRIGVN
jgi:hypothetical protein